MRCRAHGLVDDACVDLLRMGLSPLEVARVMGESTQPHLQTRAALRAENVARIPHGMALDPDPSNADETKGGRKRG